MAASTDKLIVANHTAMTAKYGAPGVALIDAALQRLIAADVGRGFTTLLVDIEDAAQMARYGGSPVVNGKDKAGAKRAVDALFTALNPDFIMLLDGPDVVPHITLDAISGLSDGDATIDSDLPYACAAGYSRRASSYLAVTRVVGRLPMTAGHNDAQGFADLIDRCAAHRPMAQEAFKSYFAISADVWKVSTQLSLSAVFGDHGALSLSPPSGHAGIDGQLASPAHFINCHGAAGDPNFYGQSGTTYPVAMESLKVSPNITPGTVAAAECCYGAMLYDHTMLGFDQPLCMSYLLKGAVAFMGSTTIAYGPSASNAQADLITQYFLEEVLKGASTGRAMLRARQRFIAASTMAGQTNLKTLAQFVLYGDPSLVAVELPNEALSAETAIVADAKFAPAIAAGDDESMRKQRRLDLQSDGLSLAAGASHPAGPAKTESKAVDRVRAIAQTHGFTVPPEVFGVTGGTQFKAAAKAMNREPQVVVFCEKQETAGPVPLWKAMVAHILGDGITAVEISESR